MDIIQTKEDLKEAFAIREEVFVLEQNVPTDEEYDEYESTSRHLLAYGADGLPAGTARWRCTTEGIKLERFAVRKRYRGAGIGGALVAATLEDIQQQQGTDSKTKYLHAQLDAVPLYARHGFQKVGDMFEECAIMHYKMVLPPK